MKNLLRLNGQSIMVRVSTDYQQGTWQADYVLPPLLPNMAVSGQRRHNL